MVLDIQPLSQSIANRIAKKRAELLKKAGNAKG